MKNATRNPQLSLKIYFNEAPLSTRSRTEDFYFPTANDADNADFQFEVYILSVSSASSADE